MEEDAVFEAEDSQDTNVNAKKRNNFNTVLKNFGFYSEVLYFYAFSYIHLYYDANILLFQQNGIIMHI